MFFVQLKTAWIWWALSHSALDADWKLPSQSRGMISCAQSDGLEAIFVIGDDKSMIEIQIKL